MQNELPSVREAVDVFRRTTGLDTRILPPEAPSQDGHLAIRTEDGRSFNFLYEVKATIDRRDRLKTFKNLHRDALLITRSLSTAMAEQCRENDI